MVTMVLRMISTTILPVLILSCIALSQSKQQSPIANSTWDAAIVAKGGRERLHAVHSLYVITSMPENDTAYDLFAFSSYSYSYIYGGRREDTTKIIWNGKLHCSWWLSPNGKHAQPIIGKEEDRKQMVWAQFLYMMETKWQQPTILKAEKMRLGFSKVDVVDVEAAGYQARFYLDSKTHLPNKVYLPYKGKLIEGAEGEILGLTDYTSVNGIMMPVKISRSYATISGGWKEAVKYEIDPTYYEEFFYHPPTLRTLPESWR